MKGTTPSWLDTDFGNLAEDLEGEGQMTSDSSSEKI